LHGAAHKKEGKRNEDVAFEFLTSISTKILDSCVLLFGR